MHLVSLNLSVELIVWIKNRIEPSTKHRTSNTWMAKRQVENFLSMRGKPQNSQSNEHWTVWKCFVFWTIFIVKNGSYAICEISRKSLYPSFLSQIWKIKTTTFELTARWILMTTLVYFSLEYQWWDATGLNTSMMKIAIFIVSQMLARIRVNLFLFVGPFYEGTVIIFDSTFRLLLAVFYGQASDDDDIQNHA